MPGRASAQAVADLVAGHVDIAFDPLGNQFVRSGKLRALAFFGGSTAPAEPAGVPSFKQAGPTDWPAGSAVGAVDGDHPHRPRRYRLDHLQRALQPYPHADFARPDLARPGGLEHRHHLVHAEGRRADQCLVMPGPMHTVCRTGKEVREKLALLQSFTDQSNALAILSEQLDHDVSGYPLDGPLPDLRPVAGAHSRRALLLRSAREHGLSLREVYHLVASARGHQIVVATAGQIAAHMVRRVEEGAADGFNIMPAYFPGELDGFTAQVVPILQAGPRSNPVPGNHPATSSAAGSAHNIKTTGRPGCGNACLTSKRLVRSPNPSLVCAACHHTKPSRCIPGKGEFHLDG
jgi:hypothetical protein